MLNQNLIKLVSKMGLFFLILGIGVSVAGFIAYIGEATHANKGTMIAGLVTAAIGHLFVTSRSLMNEEF